MEFIKTPCSQILMALQVILGGLGLSTLMQRNIIQNSQDYNFKKDSTLANLDELYGIGDRVLAFENHQTGLLISLAGPGTGKTYSLLRRIKTLTIQHGVQPDEICYLTFIKEIAKAFNSDYHEEFRDKVGEKIKPRISTLHSFSCRLIRNRGFSIGYDGPLYFMNFLDKSSDPSKIFITDLVKIVQSVKPFSISELEHLIYLLKKAWQNNIDPKAINPDLVPVLKLIRQLAKSYRVVEWDETIPMAHFFFSDPDHRQEWIARIKHIFVDEFQDFNKAEQAFVKDIQSVVTSMVIVGDDNQSIFSARGGSPEALRELNSSESLDRVTLSKCRRCKENILSAANRFLHWMNPNAIQMIAEKEGGQASCICFKSAKAEVEFLIDFLRTKISELPENPKPKQGIVCLFPSHRVLDNYYAALQEHTPLCSGKVEHSRERQLLSLLLQLVVNPHQKFLERILLELFKAIKPRHKAEIVKLIFERDISTPQAMDQFITTNSLPNAITEAGHSYIETCSILSSKDPQHIAEVIGRFINRDPNMLFQLTVDLLGQIKDSGQDEIISTFCDHALPESVQQDDTQHSVLFLTMHSCKGLTKKTVVMPGLEESWLPGQSTGGELEEKKRLFYVAITRATDDLLITCPRSRAKGDSLNYPAPGRRQFSHFVRQAGIHIDFQQ